MRIVALLTLTGASLASLLLHAADKPAEPKAAPDPKGVEYFEKHVRPMLVEHCISCHGPKKEQASLRLDSRDGLTRGSDNGPVVVPGKPDESTLIRAVRHMGKVKMPPKIAMKPEEVEHLVEWVRIGAPWPDEAKTGTKSPAEQVAEIRKKHWSFQPVREPAAPAVKNAAWVRNPVDAFVLAKLEAKGFSPAAPADRRALIRRATFDLTGLPPTPREIADFENDTTADAFATVVDRLLASPHYGERWGRHWLDVARYADTKGYVFVEERRFPYAYTYRDYVIAAFNDDKPYDQFIIEQLAADQLPPGEDKRPLAAMGFLTLGRRFLNNTHDIIDDRIDVTMRGLQGMTVACARCHDHKFDPIPTKDYYSLYGVFASSIEPKDLPLIAMPRQTEAFAAYEKELKAREQKVAEFLRKRHGELTAQFRGRAADYLLAVRDAHLLPGEDHYEALTAGDLKPPMVKRWEAFLDKAKKGHHPVFAPWLAFAALPQKEFAATAPGVVKTLAADAKKPTNALLAKAFADKTPATLRDVAQIYRDQFAEVEKQWQEAALRGDKALPDAAAEELRQALYGAAAPHQVPLAEIAPFFDRADSDQRTKLQKAVDTFKATSPAAPPRAMVLNDAPTPTQPHVLLRGNPANRGDAVPRQFLLVLAGDGRKPFAKGSGRLELAQAIAAKDNPLTARVMANRVWLHHFGAGLVRTPSDFGLRGEAPTHPELLDFLAARFMANGWSVKQLHRLILLSNTYQQGSAADAKLMAADPDNALLGRASRRRLDFESLRDSLLFASGRLDATTRGGPAVELTATTRRTVYGFIDRQNLPGLFRTFDFPTPDATNPQRYTTTVPQQALFLMNSPFVVEQAKALANRPEVKGQIEPTKRIEQMYLLCYGRKPDADEVALGVKFLEAAEKPEGDQGLAAWEKYAQVLLLANEFAFVD